MRTQYQLWTAMRPTVVGYCLWTLYTNWIYIALADEVSQGFEHIFLWHCSQLLGAQLCNNVSEPSTHDSFIIRSNVHKVPTFVTQTEQKCLLKTHIKAFLTSMLKPEWHKYANTENKSLFQKKREEAENIYFSLFEAHNTIKNKIKVSLKNRINLKSIKKWIKKNLRKPLNKRCKKTWKWKTKMQK